MYIVCVWYTNDNDGFKSVPQLYSTLKLNTSYTREKRFHKNAFNFFISVSSTIRLRRIVLFYTRIIRITYLLLTFVLLEKKLYYFIRRTKYTLCNACKISTYINILACEIYQIKKKTARFAWRPFVNRTPATGQLHYIGKMIRTLDCFQTAEFLPVRVIQSFINVVRIFSFRIRRA